MEAFLVPLLPPVALSLVLWAFIVWVSFKATGQGARRTAAAVSAVLSICGAIAFLGLRLSQKTVVYRDDDSGQGWTFGGRGLGERRVAMADKPDCPPTKTTNDCPHAQAPLSPCSPRLHRCRGDSWLRAVARRGSSVSCGRIVSGSIQRGPECSRAYSDACARRGSPGLGQS